MLFDSRGSLDILILRSQRKLMVTHNGANLTWDLFNNFLQDVCYVQSTGLLTADAPDLK